MQGVRDVARPPNVPGVNLRRTKPPRRCGRQGRGRGSHHAREPRHFGLDAVRFNAELGCRSFATLIRAGHYLLLLS